MAEVLQRTPNGSIYLSESVKICIRNFKKLNIPPCDFNRKRTATRDASEDWCKSLCDHLQKSGYPTNLDQVTKWVQKHPWIPKVDEDGPSGKRGGAQERAQAVRQEFDNISSSSNEERENTQEVVENSQLERADEGQDLEDVTPLAELTVNISSNDENSFYVTASEEFFAQFNE